MQPQNLINFADEVLPKRKNQKAIELKGKAQLFFTNYYTIKFNEKAGQLFQYSLDSSQVPNDNTNLIDRLVESAKPVLREKIGYICSKGNMVWGNIENNSALTIQSQDKLSKEGKKYNLIFKIVKRILFKDMMERPQTKNQALQIMNVNIKKRLRKLKMLQLTRGVYFKEKQFARKPLEQIPITIWQGSSISMALIWNQPYIQIDKKFRVLRQATLLSEIKEMPKESIRILIGSSVIANYGNRKTYKIKDFLFNKTPRDTFEKANQTGSISYAQYYQQAYNRKITDLKQPLVLVENPLEKSKNFKGKINDILLVPQLVSLCGIPQKILSDYRKAEIIAKVMKISPQERLESSAEVIKQLNSGQERMFDIEGIKTMNGYVLNPPNIEVCNKKSVKTANGQFKLLQPILNPCVLDDVYFVYSDESQFDQQDAYQAVQTLENASKAFKIDINSKNVHMVGIYSQRKQPIILDWLQNTKRALQERKDKNKPPQMIIFFFKPNQVKFYAELKRFVTFQARCPSQCVRKSTLKNKVMAKASSVILQINAKVGGALWKIISNSEYIRKKKVMYAGLSISKGKSGSAVSLVGTRNLEMNNFFSDCKIDKDWKKREDIQKQVFENLFYDWGKYFFRQNNRKILPESIIIFRQGLSDQQIKQQVPMQIGSLYQKMIKKFGQMMNQPNYDPDVLYIVVNKKIITKFYVQNKGTNKKNGCQNPPSGSVITSELSKDGHRDFHLVPQFSESGTISPTLFKIAYQSRNCKITEEDVINFTFEQCFNYFNWTGAVRVPGCLQNANKLSKLISEHIMKDGPLNHNNEGLQKHVYFL